MPHLAWLGVFQMLVQFWIFWPIWPLCCLLVHFNPPFSCACRPWPGVRGVPGGADPAAHLPVLGRHLLPHAAYPRTRHAVRYVWDDDVGLHRRVPPAPQQQEDLLHHPHVRGAVPHRPAPRHQGKWAIRPGHFIPRTFHEISTQYREISLFYYPFQKDIRRPSSHVVWVSYTWTGPSGNNDNKAQSYSTPMINRIVNDNHPLSNPYLRPYPLNRVYYPPEVRSVGVWEYFCCNTSLFSRYENYCILMQIEKYSWVVKIRHTSEAVPRPQCTPWPSFWPQPFGPWSV